MSDEQLKLVGPSVSEYEQEFAPLPFYPWSTRPDAYPLEHDEAATALYLAHGDEHLAAQIVRVPYVRFARLLRSSPRLQRVHDETKGETLARAASIQVQTLFDPGADARRLEWASTKVMQSNLARGHWLAPAPASSATTSIAVNAPQREIVFRWKTPTGELVEDPDVE